MTAVLETPARRRGRLFYRGPARDELRDAYAKAGRIDDRAPIQSAVEVRIDAPIARVWHVLSDPEAWPRIDRDIRDVELGAGVRANARFAWTNGKTRLESQFAVVDPERELTWTGHALGGNVVHRHVLRAIDADTTQLRCEESMTGALMVLFYSEAKLHAALEKWLTAIKAAAERAQ